MKKVAVMAVAIIFVGMGVPAVSAQMMGQGMGMMGSGERQEMMEQRGGYGHGMVESGMHGGERHAEQGPAWQGQKADPQMGESAKGGSGMMHRRGGGGE